MDDLGKGEMTQIPLNSDEQNMDKKGKGDIGSEAPSWSGQRGL